MIQLLLVLHRPTGCSFIRFHVKHYISVRKQKTQHSFSLILVRKMCIHWWRQKNMIVCVLSIRYEANPTEVQYTHRKQTTTSSSCNIWVQLYRQRFVYRKVERFGLRICVSQTQIKSRVICDGSFRSRHYLVYYSLYSKCDYVGKRANSLVGYCREHAKRSNAYCLYAVQMTLALFSCLFFFVSHCQSSVKKISFSSAKHLPDSSV